MSQADALPNDTPATERTEPRPNDPAAIRTFFEPFTLIFRVLRLLAGSRKDSDFPVQPYPDDDVHRYAIITYTVFFWLMLLYHFANIIVILVSLGRGQSGESTFFRLLDASLDIFFSLIVGYAVYLLIAGVARLRSNSDA